MTPTHEAPEPALFQRTLRLRTRDGATLVTRVYEPRDEVRGTLLLAGAVGVPQRYYGHFAHAAAAHGLRAVTFDYRHFGESAASEGPAATLSRWGEEDYHAALQFCFEASAGKPVSVLGHSLGGQVLALSDLAADLHSAVTVASASGCIARFERDRGRVLLLFRHAFPVVTRLFGNLPGWIGLGATLPTGAAMQWRKWCLDPDYFLGEHPEYASRLAAFRAPLTMLNFVDDPVSPEVNVRWLAERFESAPVVRRMVAPAALGVRHVGHVGFFRRACQASWPSLFAQVQQPSPDFALRPTPAPDALADAVMDDLRYGTV